MTTTKQKLLGTITDAAHETNLNVLEFKNYDSINVVQMKLKHFTNENELNLTISSKLVSADYLFKVFNELNNTPNDNN